MEVPLSSRGIFSERMFTGNDGVISFGIDS